MVRFPPFPTAGALVALAAAGLGVYWLVARDPAPPAAPVAAGDNAPAVPAPAQPAAGPPAPSAPAAAPAMLRFPDGSELPLLNSVTTAPRLVWHRLIPFTKVVGKERDANGVEWYVHENGARSTSRWQLRNGVREPVGEISMPKPAQPIVDDGIRK